MKWKKGDVVMANWEGCYYEAKIINVWQSDGETHYKIHYKNWSSRWDEIIPESKTDKWKAFTAEAKVAAKKQIKDLKAASKRSAADDATPTPPSKKQAEDQTSQLYFPETLQNILYKDYLKMTCLGLYVALPAKVTIRQIIQELCSKIAASDEEEITLEVEYADGRKVTGKTTKHEFAAFAHMVERLINSLFTSSLCFGRDKQQVQWLQERLVKMMDKKNDNDMMKPFAPSEHFGVVYLLRFFIKLNSDSDFIDAYDHYSFVKHGSYLLKHLLDNIDNYYDENAYNKTDPSDLSAI